MTEKYCYNNGCPHKKFVESENGPDACIYHPGSPYFHDAYKIWNCCGRKSVDFSEFLSIKGCAVGPHNPIKPATETPPPQPRKCDIVEELVKVDMVPERITVRPEPDSEMINLKQDVAPSLTKRKLQMNENQQEDKDKECSNRGCSTKYSEKDDNPACVHHSGQPIFHEGLKYWSCCNKKSMEFDEFMKQKGCATGEHCWFSKKEVTCRFDFHQTATHVNVTIYSKDYDPDYVKIRANGVKLVVELPVTDGSFSKEWILYGVINEKESAASLLSTKVEIKLRKAEPKHWHQLEFPSNSKQIPTEEASDEGLKVDTISLDDL